METPRIGDTRKASEIGRKGTARYVLRLCRCGSRQWVQINKFLAGKCLVCKSCANQKKSETQKGTGGPSWKGGRVRLSGGYIGAYVHEDDPMIGMAKHGARNGRCRYVLEHRLVMARHLGRPLTSLEVIHHKNGVKDDNRIENLELKSSHNEHMAEHSAGYRDGFDQGYRDGLQRAREELGK
jgi:hypothetical protein